MSEILVLVSVIGFGVSFANGANDVSKSIATLVGSGIANYGRAIAWGTLWTAFGAAVAAFFTHAMLQTFGSISRSSTIHPFSTAIADRRDCWYGSLDCNSHLRELTCINHSCDRRLPHRSFDL